MSFTILLTGATGFLGSCLLRRLILEKYRVIVLKRSFSSVFRIADIIADVKYYDIDKIKLEEAFSNKIDMIIHCATDYGRKQSAVTSILESNLLLPLMLLEIGKKNGVSSFINTDTILDKRIGDYSLSKSQFKEWLKTLCTDMIGINIALEHFYGPFDDKSKFVANMIEKLLDEVKQIDLTKGEQKRDFIYIDDVIEAFMKIIETISVFPNGFHNFEIGTNESITIRKFVETIKKIANNNITTLDFGAIAYREHEVMESLADTREVRKLGWSPRFSIEEGLRLTIECEKRGRK